MENEGLMKIVCYGAESTGKTTLAKALADYYDTAWVPEYSRDYLQDKFDQTGEICAYEDLIPIAEGQLRLENERAKGAKNGLLFSDTNVLQTYYYGKAYYNNFQHQALWNLAQAHRYDFYFLTAIDTPWVSDDLRDKPEEREDMHRLFKTSLDKNHLPYMLLEGNQSKRMEAAVAKIDSLCEKC